MATNFINLADIDRSVQQAQIGDMQMENARLARQDREREMQRQSMSDQQKMRLRDIYSQSGGDLNKARQELYNQGFYEEGTALDKTLGEQSKQRADIDKSQLETTSKRIGLIGNGMKFILDNPTKDNALMTFNQLRSVGVLTPEQYDEYTAKLPDDPEMIRRGAEVLFRGALDAKDQLAKYETRDAGGSVQTQQIDPVTGQIRTVGTINKTQTPDSIASNERMIREGALNRGVQIRGQNLTDARSREANQNGKAPNGYRWSADGQSLEVIPGGPGEKSSSATEGERKAATLLSRLQFSENQLKNALIEKDAFGNIKLDKNGNPVKSSAEKPTEFAQALRGIGLDTAANYATPEKRQQVEAAQLDILDAALTLGTGAAYTKEQLEGYRKSYFPQLGDDNATIVDKQQRLTNVIEAAKIAAGRAAPTQQQEIQTGTPMLDRRNAGMNIPTIGTVKGGYVFKGGNPANPNSWKKAK